MLLETSSLVSKCFAGVSFEAEIWHYDMLTCIFMSNLLCMRDIVTKANISHVSVRDFIKKRKYPANWHEHIAQKACADHVKHVRCVMAIVLFYPWGSFKTNTPKVRETFSVKNRHVIVCCTQDLQQNHCTEHIKTRLAFVHSY